MRIQNGKITGETRLCDIEEMPGFQRFGRFLMECRPSTWERLRQIPLAALDADNHNKRITNGLMHVQRLMEKGVQVDYEFWDADDIAGESGRINTKLFYLPGQPGAPFVLLCPGGGYQSVCTFIEGFPTAAELNKKGYNTFVLSYRVREKELMPGPIEDVAQALRFIFAHADLFKINKKYAMMGFSAGGHLAAEFGTVNFGARRFQLPMPSAMVLCYAAIDLRTLGNNETADKFRKTFEGEKNILSDYCINLHMDSSYPPTILWQCVDDEIISFENYHIMQNRLAELGIPHHAMAYPHGGHGMRLPHDTESELWMNTVIHFLESYLPIGEALPRVLKQ